MRRLYDMPGPLAFVFGGAFTGCAYTLPDGLPQNLALCVVAWTQLALFVGYYRQPRAAAFSTNDRPEEDR